jgi:hypothetical protein
MKKGIIMVTKETRVELGHAINTTVEINTLRFHLNNANELLLDVFRALDGALKDINSVHKFTDVDLGDTFAKHVGVAQRIATRCDGTRFLHYEDRRVGYPSLCIVVPISRSVRT